MQPLISVYNIIFLCLGTILVILGLTCIALTPTLYEKVITSVLTLGPDSEMFRRWQNPTEVINMDVYFFNWTNPEDVYDPEMKPTFEEVGPYRYRQTREKTNITWNWENQTMTYQIFENFYYDEENSPTDYNDVVTSINMVALSAAHIGSESGYVLKQAIKLSMMSSDISVTKSIRELMFEGYDEPMLTLASAFPFLSGSTIDRFRWFHGKNATIGSEGVYNMAIAPGPNFGTMKNWNYENETHNFEGHCASISGSAGSEFYPRNLKQDHIRFFTPDMCKTMQFDFEKKVDVKGIPCYRYSAGDEMLDNGTIIKENACYCKGSCMPSGVVSVSPCRQGAPVYLSLPHFYHGDSSYVDGVEGLSPEKDKHEFYFTLEPNLGIITDTAARMQVNVLLKQFSEFSLYDDIPKTTMFPVFWTEVKVPASEETVFGLTLLLNLPVINTFISGFLILIGLLDILGVVLYVKCYKQKKFEKRRISEEEVPLEHKPPYIRS